MVAQLNEVSLLVSGFSGHRAGQHARIVRNDTDYITADSREQRMYRCPELRLDLEELTVVNQELD